MLTRNKSSIHRQRSLGRIREASKFVVECLERRIFLSTTMNVAGNLTLEKIGGDTAIFQDQTGKIDDISAVNIAVNPDKPQQMFATFITQDGNLEAYYYDSTTKQWAQSAGYTGNMNGAFGNPDAIFDKNGDVFLVYTVKDATGDYSVNFMESINSGQTFNLATEQTFSSAAALGLQAFHYIGNPTVAVFPATKDASEAVRITFAAAPSHDQGEAIQYKILDTDSLITQGAPGQFDALVAIPTANIILTPQISVSVATAPGTNNGSFAVAYQGFIKNSQQTLMPGLYVSVDSTGEMNYGQPVMITGLNLQPADFNNASSIPADDAFYSGIQIAYGP